MQLRRGEARRLQGKLLGGLIRERRKLQEAQLKIRKIEINQEILKDVGADQSVFISKILFVDYLDLAVLEFQVTDFQLLSKGRIA